jgi:mono/diheme cytochrome c family protein
VNAFLLATAIAVANGQPSAIAVEGPYGETPAHFQSTPSVQQVPSSYGATTPKLTQQRASEGGPATIPEMWGAWCARCHADDGSGKVNEPTVTVEPMDFTDCQVTSAEPDADWERAIAKGGPGVGLSPEMPGFEDSLTPEQITAFVSHMRGFCKQAGWPSGNTNFPRPILTEKAFPENELVILPAVAHFSEEAAPSITEGMFKVVYERRFGKRSMFEIAVPLVTTNAFLTRTGGLGDIEVAIKHALYAAGTRIVSLGAEVVLPSGYRFKDHGNGTPIFEPYLSAGMMVRDWYVQTQLKAEFPVDRLRASRAGVYNAYLGRDTGAAPNTWTIGVEVNGEIVFPLQGITRHLVAVTPQVRKGLTGTGALAASVGMMVPLNKRETQGVRWVGYLLWEYLEPLRARR